MFVIIPVFSSPFFPFFFFASFALNIRLIFARKTSVRFLVTWVGNAFLFVSMGDIFLYDQLV